MDIRKQCGIFGLLIGIGTILVFWLLPFERKPIKNLDLIDNNETLESIYFVFVVFWILFSFTAKLAMILKKKKVFLNCASLMLFVFFISIAAFLPSQKNFVEFHSLQNFFGLALLYGWTLIDAVDLILINLSKRW